MHGFVANIEELTLANKNFRQVLYTAKHGQLVLMNLLPNEEIGQEIHEVDQFFRIESGDAQIIIDDSEYTCSSGFAILVPSGAKHNVINTSNSKNLQLYTLYMPPHHADQTIHPTKAVAEVDTEEFTGQTTES